jgi:hypothetical protein
MTSRTSRSRKEGGGGIFVAEENIAAFVENESADDFWGKVMGDQIVCETFDDKDDSGKVFLIIVLHKTSA